MEAGDWPPGEVSRSVDERRGCRERLVEGDLVGVPCSGVREVVTPESTRRANYGVMVMYRNGD